MSCLSWRDIFHESWENKSKFQMGGLRETGGLLLFSPVRAHLLTTASAQTPYPSPRRKRQVSSIPLCLLFPQSQRLCGSPFAAVVCLAASCALRGGLRLLRQPPDNATAFADAAVIVCAIGQIPSLQPTLFSNRLRKPATGSFAAEMDRRSARPFSLLRKRNRKKKTR